MTDISEKVVAINQLVSKLNRLTRETFGLNTEEVKKVVAELAENSNEIQRLMEDRS